MKVVLGARKRREWCRVRAMERERCNREGFKGGDGKGARVEGRGGVVRRN